jgi:hypothetical protein
MRKDIHCKAVTATYEEEKSRRHPICPICHHIMARPVALSSSHDRARGLAHHVSGRLTQEPSSGGLCSSSGLVIVTVDVVVAIDGLVLHIDSCDDRLVTLSLILVETGRQWVLKVCPRHIHRRVSTDQVQQYRSTLNRNGLNKTKWQQNRTEICSDLTWHSPMRRRFTSTYSRTPVSTR